MEPEEPNRLPGTSAEDALRRLEERLSRASETAERLIAEAAGSVREADGQPPHAASSGDPVASRDEAATGEAEPDREDPSLPPPAGWQVPPTDEDGRGSGDLELLMQFLQSVRELIPSDLQRRLTEAVRELLLAIRALIDWYLERSEQRRSAASEVQDIPIL